MFNVGDHVEIFPPTYDERNDRFGVVVQVGGIGNPYMIPRVQTIVRFASGAERAVNWLRLRKISPERMFELLGGQADDSHNRKA